MSASYIICLPQSRTMILTILFALMAIAALLQEEDVPFGQAVSGGPDERVNYLNSRGTVIISSTTVEETT